ncbi:DUF433 domain-containing protein [Tessaracoccus caeni]|uniref:DUF433 domain-containing protein n=1 Tax=Tessaracoccus caeni TaxID=3031239 RepID=UPI0023DC74FE|nr:DUF433 domain-containing protein [Tessaracoccus caeni]MDF1488325.1 hypothetical protein [Tessaracoccus caeni]
MDVYADPMLNVKDAARYLAIPESTLGRWKGTGAIHSVAPTRKGWPQLPFAAVVEAFVLQRLRQFGIPAKQIRETAEGLRRHFGDPYALARPGLGVHGKDVLVEVAGDYYRGKDLQQAAAETITGFQQVITWDADENPRRLRLMNLGADVILDPRFGWGAPVVEANKVPIESIVGQFRGGDTIADIAYDFEMNVGDVEQIIRGYLDSGERAA